MATYIQGITDYLPQVQPFKPDFNFFGSILAQKEAQYQSGYQKLSGLYGSLLNSPMIREKDIKKRDEFFQSVQQNIQKVSQADLSLETNVNTARQIFDPLLQDKNIISDMAKTKKLGNEYSLYDSYRRERPTKEHPVSAAWDGGKEALDWWRQDYAQTSDEEALQFDDPRYTPFVDVGNLFTEHLKGMNFKMTSTGLSRDSMWIMTTTNGATMVPHLTDYMTGVIGANQGVMDMYNTIASNAQHRWMAQEAPKYGGDMAATEDAYFSQIMATQQSKVAKHSKAVKTAVSNTDAAIDITQQQIDRLGVSKDDELYKILNDHLHQKEVLKSADGLADMAMSSLDPRSMLNQERMTKRRNINQAVAYGILQNQMGHLSADYAMMTSEQKMEVNPYERDFRQWQLDVQKEQIKAGLKNQAPLNPDNGYGIGRKDVAGGATPEIDWEAYENSEKAYNISIVNQDRSMVVEKFYNSMINQRRNNTDPVIRKAAGIWLNKVFGKNDPTEADLKNAHTKYGATIGVLDNNEYLNQFGSELAKQITPYRMDQQKNLYSIKAQMKLTASNQDRLFKFLKSGVGGATDTDIAFMKSMFNPNGTRKSISEFMNYWSPNYQGGLNYEQASKIYNEYHDKYVKHLSAGYTADGEPVVQPIHTMAGVNANSGGLATQYLTGTLSPGFPGQATMDAGELNRWMGANSDWGVINRANPTSKYKDDLLTPEKEDKKGLREVTQAFMDAVERETTSKSKSDKFTTGSKFGLHPITLNDAGMVGAQINISPEWLAKYNEGRKNKINYEDVKEITIVIPKDKAPGALFDKFRPQPIRSVLDAGEQVTISGFPLAITKPIVMKRTAGGMLAFEGMVKAIKPDGNWDYNIPMDEAHIDPMASPDMVYDWLMTTFLPNLQEGNLKRWNDPDNPARKQKKTYTREADDETNDETE